MNFVAIDVETANDARASICQIGLARYKNGKLENDGWRAYVDPKEDFRPINIEKHGITESDVKGAPTFPELYDRVRQYLAGNVVVSHGDFDREAIKQVCKKYDLDVPECTWLDSSKVTRCTWKERAKRGYGLADVCEMLGYEFNHHDALEDAKAAAHVLIEASRKTGLDIDGWCERVRQPISPSSGGSNSTIEHEVNPEGALFGQIVVFTGALTRPRREAAVLARAVGCEIAENVTKKTTMLVVGDQDIKKEVTKNAKYRKAEELLEKGASIEILQESDFEVLVGLSDD